MQPDPTPHDMDQIARRVDEIRTRPAKMSRAEQLDADYATSVVRNGILMDELHHLGAKLDFQRTKAAVLHDRLEREEERAAWLTAARDDAEARALAYSRQWVDERDRAARLASRLIWTLAFAGLFLGLLVVSWWPLVVEEWKWWF